MTRRASHAFAMVWLMLAATAHGALSTFLEPRLIEEMDTVRLTLRVDGTSQSEPPDLTPLMADFEVLGNQTSSRISSINGRTIASVEYQISLRPRRTGELTVPSLSVGGQRSEAIALVVRPLDPQLKQTIANMVFFETLASRNPVYVQAETVLTRRLFYSQGVQIYSDLPGVPEIENAIVIPLGETQSRSVIRGAQRYGVIEQRFAVFPETSGILRIPSISVTSSVRLQSGGRTRRSGIRVSTEDIDLQVLPIPPEYPANAPWLPATDVRLKQTWEPPISRMNVGDPLTFKLQVEAQGNRGSAIPPIPLPLPADRFKIYPEAPGMSETSDKGTVIGRRDSTYALIPTRPGKVTVPSITLAWWDTQADQLRQTTIDIESLFVSGTTPPPVRTPDPAIVPDVNGLEAETTATRSGSGISIDRRTAAIFIGLLAAVMLIWLAGRFRWLPGLLTDRDGRGSQLRLAQRQLRDAARQSDLIHFRRALMRYLMLHSAATNAAGSTVLGAFRLEPGVDARLRELDQAIYAPERPTTTEPDLESLAALAFRAVRDHSKKSPRDPLPPLYG